MIRTKSCKCGCVLFTINSCAEEVELICKDCNIANVVNIEKYTTYDCKCKSCSSETFKIKVEDNGKEEMLNIECSKCKQVPSKYYIDNKGNEIDENMRILLIIKDTISRVEENVGLLEYRIDEIENKTYYIEEDIYRLSSKSNSNKEDVDSIKTDVSDLEHDLSICNLDISSLEDSIRHLEYS